VSETGNTTGRLVGETPRADVPAWAANPAIVAETPEDTAWLTKMYVGQDAPGAIPEVGAVFNEANAPAFAVEDSAAEPETSHTAGQAAKPWKGEEGAKVPGKGNSAICVECLVHAASIVERQ
jgi:hypothetical protein